jgi:sterol 24-C-methyltransferase
MPSVSEVVPKAEPTESQLRDKQFSQILHGPKPTEQAGYLAILKKNPEAQKVASTSYFQFWDDKVPQNETPEHIAERSENYTTLVNSYYNLATDLYEYGWNEKFHFCRFYPGEGFDQVPPDPLGGVIQAVLGCWRY